MFSVSRFNSGKANRFTYKTPEGTPFKKLKDLTVGQVYAVRALYINTKGKFGDEPTAVIDTAVVNLPQHLLDTVKAMIDDGEAVAAINNGQVGFKSYEYDGKNGHGYSVEWVDLAPEIPWSAEDPEQDLMCRD